MIPIGNKKDDPEQDRHITNASDPNNAPMQPHRRRKK